MKCSAVIPVRLQSRRVPGKPLADVGGVPLLKHVWQALMGSQCTAEVVVVTDSPDVRNLVSSWGGRALVTGTAASGTERIARVADRLCGDVIVNIQCDQLGFSADCLDEFFDGWQRSGSQLFTPVYEGALSEDPAVVKAMINEGGLATHFLRRVDRASGPHAGHVGVYGYTRPMLETYLTLEPTAGELSESLEQLRFTDNGLYFATYKVAEAPLAINTTAELESARAGFLTRPEVVDRVPGQSPVS